MPNLPLSARSRAARMVGLPAPVSEWSEMFLEDRISRRRDGADVGARRAERCRCRSFRVICLARGYRGRAGRAVIHKYPSQYRTVKGKYSSHTVGITGRTTAAGTQIKYPSDDECRADRDRDKQVSCPELDPPGPGGCAHSGWQAVRIGEPESPASESS